MSPRFRLPIALLVSGTLLSATSAGALSWWPSALLWLVPVVVAARSLPLLLALPVAFAVSAAGRMLAFRTDSAAAFAAAGALVAVLALDRFATSRLPRLGLLVLPCGLVVACRLLTGTDAAPLLAPMPGLDAFAYVAGDAGTGAALLVFGLVVQGVATLACVVNRQSPDPYPHAIRDRSARTASVASFLLAMVVVAAGALRDHLGQAPAAATTSSDAVPVVCALVVVAVVGAAIARAARKPA